MKPIKHTEMRAILIDPTEGKREITVIKLSKGLQAIYKVLGCTNIEAPITYLNGDAMYCDGEVWLNYANREPEDEIKMGGFMFPDWDYPIFGKALIVGTDEEGGDADCKSHVSDFWNIQWKSYDVMMNWAERVGLI